MEGGRRSELEPGHHGLDPASAVHFLQLWPRFSALSVKSDAGTPPPALVCAATSLNAPNSC